MDIYLPVSNMVMNILQILAFGSLAGFVSGLYGIGGGVISTPVLMLFGVPTPIAVGTASVQLVGTGVAGTLKQSRLGNIDFRVGFIMLIGGYIGSTTGVQLLRYMQSLGEIDTAVGLLYIVVMTLVSFAVYLDLIKTSGPYKKIVNYIKSWYCIRVLRVFIYNGHHQTKPKTISGRFVYSLHHKPEVKYNASYVVILGLVVGFVAGMIGVGGAVIAVPAMCYLLRMDFKNAAATALFQTTLMAINLVALQSYNQAIETILGAVMLLTATITVQLGIKASLALPPRFTKLTFALLITALQIKFIINVFSRPENIFFVS